VTWIVDCGSASRLFTTTSNRETKLFIEREEQIAAGRRITYRDLALQAIAFNASKRGRLGAEPGRRINFISGYMADNKSVSHQDAVRAWHESGDGCTENERGMGSAGSQLRMTANLLHGPVQICVAVEYAWQ
jgi:hypothetical protein